MQTLKLDSSYSCEYRIIMCAHKLGIKNNKRAAHSFSAPNPELDCIHLFSILSLSYIFSEQKHINFLAPIVNNIILKCNWIYTLTLKQCIYDASKKIN